MRLLSMLCYLALCQTIAVADQVDTHVKFHPFALYLLMGGDYAWADREPVVVAVDMDAIANSNEIVGYELYRRGDWIGFKTGTNNTNAALTDVDFKYRVLCQTGAVSVVTCELYTGGSEALRKVLVFCNALRKVESDRKPKIRNELILIGMYMQDVYNSHQKEILHSVGQFAIPQGSPIKE